jgi:hypothetical protein
MYKTVKILEEFMKVKQIISIILFFISLLVFVGCEDGVNRENLDVSNESVETTKITPSLLFAQKSMWTGRATERIRDEELNKIRSDFNARTAEEAIEEHELLDNYYYVKVIDSQLVAKGSNENSELAIIYGLIAMVYDDGQRKEVIEILGSFIAPNKDIYHFQENHAHDTDPTNSSRLTIVGSGYMKVIIDNLLTEAYLEENGFKKLAEPNGEEVYHKWFSVNDTYDLNELFLPPVANVN